MELQQKVKISTYHKLFTFVILLGLLLCSFILFRQYCRDQVYVSTCFIKVCDIQKNQDKKFLNIVSKIRGSKNISLMLNKLEPLGYNGLELVESYFYRGDLHDIPTFGTIPSNIKLKCQEIKGSALRDNIKNESDCVIWVFKILDPFPTLPQNQKCVINFHGISINRINHVLSRLK